MPGNPTFKGKLDGQGTQNQRHLFSGGASLGFRLERGPDPIVAAKQALAGFDSFLTEAIKAWEVPGMAVSIVKDGEVIYAQGFGKRDVDKNLPVTPRTLFAIGSCTKAFTTFVMGTLVDEGKLDWDTPVADLSPRPADERPDRHRVDHPARPGDAPLRPAPARPVLVQRDAHRQGVFDRLAHFEPTEPLRSKFQYNNMMFMLAGYLVEKVDGRPWEEAVRTRIFRPLGMTSSNFSVLDSQKADDFARPYDEQEGKIARDPVPRHHERRPGRLDQLERRRHGPLARRAHPQRQDRRQVDHQPGGAGRPAYAAHDRSASRQTKKEISPGRYALGWAIDDLSRPSPRPPRRRDRRLHGQHLPVPRRRLGPRVLTNKDGTPLPELISRHACRPRSGARADRLAGEGSTSRTRPSTRQRRPRRRKIRCDGPAPRPPTRSRNTRATTSIPGYGVIQIELRDGQLIAATTSIEATLEHWHYEVFNAPKAANDPALARSTGSSSSRPMSRAMLTVAATAGAGLKPIVFTKRPAARLSDAAFLKQYVGAYELAGQTVNIRLNGNSLVLDTPGQPSVTLVPDQDDSFKVKKQSELSIRFVAAEAPGGAAMMLDTSGGVFTAKRKKP